MDDKKTEIINEVIITDTPAGANITVQTRDYSKFRTLTGNRGIDKRHVRRLVNNMLAVGNLTGEFPIVVNEYMEVIDGQHRLAALQELGWPIYYRVQPSLNLATIRGINQAAQNWSWRDYATSFAQQGNSHYQRFLDLVDVYNIGFATACTYCGLTNARSNLRTKHFKQGDISLYNVDETVRLLDQYKEIAGLLNFDRPQFAIALYHIMRSEHYDHARMVHKASIYKPEFKRQLTIVDYMRMIEEVYNYNAREDDRVRLFV